MPTHPTWTPRPSPGIAPVRFEPEALARSDSVRVARDAYPGRGVQTKRDSATLALFQSIAQRERLDATLQLLRGHAHHQHLAVEAAGTIRNHAINKRASRQGRRRFAIRPQRFDGIKARRQVRGASNSSSDAPFPLLSKPRVDCDGALRSLARWANLLDFLAVGGTKSL